MTADAARAQQRQAALCRDQHHARKKRETASKEHDLAQRIASDLPLHQHVDGGEHEDGANHVENAAANFVARRHGHDETSHKGNAGTTDSNNYAAK